MKHINRRIENNYHNSTSSLYYVGLLKAMREEDSTHLAE